MAGVQTQQQASDKTQELAAKKGIQSRTVQAYVEPGVYLEFKVIPFLQNHATVARADRI